MLVKPWTTSDRAWTYLTALSIEKSASGEASRHATMAKSTVITAAARYPGTRTMRRRRPGEALTCERDRDDAGVTVRAGDRIRPETLSSGERGCQSPARLTRLFAARVGECPRMAENGRTARLRSVA
jgi:hypothetical protein